MKRFQIVSGTALAIAALACAHKQQEPGASDNSRIKPSSANTARDTAAEYGNQRTRMGSPSDSSRREQPTSTASGPTSSSSSVAGTAGQSDPNLIGSPAWWRTHLTADGKPRP